MGSKLKKGINDLETWCKQNNREDLLLEWSDENGDLKPCDVHYGSYTYVWWKCKQGHPSWRVQVKNRTLGSKCPYCTHLKPIVGENDLKTLYPNIVIDWDYSKNLISPSDVLPKSNKKAWWKCHVCGHEWEAIIQSRTNGNGCPVCGRKKSEEGRHITQLIKSGTLKSARPDLASEWNYERNELTPMDYAPQSNKRVWWICKKGHEWEATINSRFRGVGCPICNKEKGTSFPEQTILFYLSAATKTENRFDFEGFEIDIYLPSLNIGIEYDGIHFHSSEKSILREQRKNEFLASKGVRLIRIKESKNIKEIFIKNDVVYYPYERDYRNIDLLIEYLSSLLGLNIKDIDHNRDRPKIYEQYILSEKENSIIAKHPELLKEWDFDKNGKLNPYYFRYSSSHKVWWKCRNGHSWNAVISSRHLGNGCPYCSNQLLLKGYNDLATLNPPFLLDWDYSKNVIQPSNILGFPKKSVWWKCHICGYEWKATIDKRGQGRGCPKCARELTKSKGLNTKLKAKGSFADNYPELLKEWDFEKNQGIEPQKLMCGSGKSVWWICSKCGQSWKTLVKNRTSGHGCPHCSGVKASEQVTSKRIAEKGSFADNHSDLLKDWDYSKNSIDPHKVTNGCVDKVWWKCHICGLEWKATIVNRTRGRGCPKCANDSRGQKHSKKVKNVEDNIIFESMKLAAEHYNCNPDLIGKSCKTGKPYKGYHWKFID